MYVQQSAQTDEAADLQVSSAVVEVTHVIVAHADAFLDEVGLVVIKFCLQSIMPLSCLALLLLNLSPEDAHPLIHW